MKPSAPACAPCSTTWQSAPPPHRQQIVDHMPQVTSRNPDPIGRPRIVWGHPPAQRRTDRVLVVHPRHRRRRRAEHRPRARHRLRAVLPPLGRGFLSGRIRSIDDFDTDDFRRSSPRFQGENFTKNLEVLDQVVAIAERKGVTPSQLALAWVLAQGTDIVPIPGTRRIANLQENVAAVDIDLSADDLAAIDQVTRPGWPPVSATPLLACRPSTAEPLTAQPSVQSTHAISVGHRISRGRHLLNGRQIVAAARSVSAQRFRRRHGVRPGDRSASPRCRLP